MFYIDAVKTSAIGWSFFWKKSDRVSGFLSQKCR